MALRSWNCTGCTNFCFQMYEGKIAKYCRPMAEQGANHKQWIGDKITCLDYTMDPEATDPQIRLWRPPKKKGETNEKSRNQTKKTDTV